jgi:guanine deaminase
MCLAAIYWARLDRLVYAVTRTDAASIGFDDDLIYREITLPPEARQLPATHLPLPQARAVFDAWLRKGDRVAY